MLDESSVSSIDIAEISARKPSCAAPLKAVIGPDGSEASSLAVAFSADVSPAVSVVSKLAFGCAMRMVDFKSCHPFSRILAISVPSVAFMCPLMSLAATILFKDAGNQFVAVWLQTTAFNFPMAFFWQLIYAGPIVRFIFRHIFPEKENVKETTATM